MRDDREETRDEMRMMRRRGGDQKDETKMMIYKM